MLSHARARTQPFFNMIFEDRTHGGKTLFSAWASETCEEKRAR